MLAGFKDLKVYQRAYDLSMEIYQLSKTFPKEELYSLTDQMRRSSRSVCANIAEAYRKRSYPKLFKLSLTNADSEVSETLVWIDYARDCGYLSKKDHESLSQGYETSYVKWKFHRRPDLVLVEQIRVRRRACIRTCFSSWNR